MNPKIIAAAVIIAFSAGWMVQGWRHEASLTSAMEKTILLQQENDIYARKVVKDFNVKQADQLIVYRNIKKAVPNVTDNRICFANANALSVWNAALTGSMSKTSSRTAETPPDAHTISDAEVLTNVIENFEQAKQIRDQLNALIDWQEAQ